MLKFSEIINKFLATLVISYWYTCIKQQAKVSSLNKIATRLPCLITIFVLGW